jgi:hypothetical protein
MGSYYFLFQYKGRTFAKIITVQKYDRSESFQEKKIVSISKRGS